MHTSRVESLFFTRPYEPPHPSLDRGKAVGPKKGNDIFSRIFFSRLIIMVRIRAENYNTIDADVRQRIRNEMKRQNPNLVLPPENRERALLAKLYKKANAEQREKYNNIFEDANIIVKNDSRNFVLERMNDERTENQPQHNNNNAVVAVRNPRNGLLRVADFALRGVGTLTIFGQLTKTILDLIHSYVQREIHTAMASRVAVNAVEAVGNQLHTMSHSTVDRLEEITRGSLASIAQMIEGISASVTNGLVTTAGTAIGIVVSYAVYRGVINYFAERRQQQNIRPVTEGLQNIANAVERQGEAVREQLQRVVTILEENPQHAQRIANLPPVRPIADAIQPQEAPRLDAFQALATELLANV